MNKMVSEQTLLFLTAIQIGILMGCVFDLIRIFRKLIKHPNFFVQIEDMLYWVFCGFMGFYMLYICNYAAIRPFIFIGIILGAAFYFLTFSIWFMKLATIVINYIRALIGKMIRLLLIPIRWLLNAMIIWPVKYIRKKIKTMMWLVKLKYRKYKRIQYEQKMDKKVDQYLKNRKA